MNNPLLTTLQIIETLSRGDSTLAALGEQFNISPASVRRSIADGRLYGADIVSRKVGATWRFTLTNWDDCKRLCLRWIELERTRRIV